MLPLPDTLIWLALGLAVLICLARQQRSCLILLGIALLTALWLERLSPVAALVSLAGRPLIAHVLDRLEPQVDRLARAPMAVATKNTRERPINIRLYMANSLEFFCANKCVAQVSEQPHGA